MRNGSVFRGSRKTDCAVRLPYRVLDRLSPIFLMSLVAHRAANGTRTCPLSFFKPVLRQQCSRWFIVAALMLLGGVPMVEAELKDPLAPVDARPAERAEQPEQDARIPAVRAIITGRIASVAVVGNQPVREGDKLGEWIITRISNDAVYFENSDGTRHRIEPDEPFSIQEPDEQVRF